MLKKMFEFEHTYPYGSFYTERDIEYLVSKSKSLSFNRGRFFENSHFMGVVATPRRYEEFCMGINDNRRPYVIEDRWNQLCDVLEGMYYVKNEHDGLYIGTSYNKINTSPFFKRWDKEVFYTIPAIFAGRDYGKKVNAIRESCSADCYVCKTKISNKKYDEFIHINNKLYGGVFFGLQKYRFEVLCKDCYIKYIIYKSGVNKNFNELCEGDKKYIKERYDDINIGGYCDDLSYPEDSYLKFVRFVSNMALT